MTLIAHLAQCNATHRRGVRDKIVARWQLTEVSKVAIDMVGLFGRNKVKEYVRGYLSTNWRKREEKAEQNKIVRLWLERFSATWRASGIDDSLD